MEDQREVQTFLKDCSLSSDKAYQSLKSVLENLQNLTSRAQARVFLSSVQKYIDSHPDYSVKSLSLFHFRIHNLSLTGYEGTIRKKGKLSSLH